MQSTIEFPNEIFEKALNVSEKLSKYYRNKEASNLRRKILNEVNSGQTYQELAMDFNLNNSLIKLKNNIAVALKFCAENKT